MSKKWYIVHTYSGQEARARQALLERVKAHGREAFDFFTDRKVLISRW